MNLLVFSPNQLTSECRGRLSPQQELHVELVLKLKAGDTLRVALLNGRPGVATLLSDPRSSAAGRCEVDIAWTTTSPPPGPDLIICVALPRPKVFRRILFALTVQGIKNIHVFHAFRVEKSYWGSPMLEANSVSEIILKGLEQSADWIPPTVRFHHRFRPFVEDDLPAICEGKRLVALDKRGDRLAGMQKTDSTCVLIGPEGGFIDFELEMLQAAGAELRSLGPRILTVELATTRFISIFS